MEDTLAGTCAATDEAMSALEELGRAVHEARVDLEIAGLAALDNPAVARIALAALRLKAEALTWPWGLPNHVSLSPEEDWEENHLEYAE